MKCEEPAFNNSSFIIHNSAFQSDELRGQWAPCPVTMTFSVSKMM